MLRDNFSEITDLKMSVERNHKNKGKNTNNELDIAFTYKNTLYITENKIDALYENKLNDYIYKLHSISNKFGLRPKCIFLFLNEKKELEKKHDSLKKIAQLKIDFLTIEELSPENFKKSFEEIIK
jgi:hypothetical protein